MPEITAAQRTLFDEQGTSSSPPLVPHDLVAHLRRAFEAQTAAWAPTSTRPSTSTSRWSRSGPTSGSTTPSSASSSPPACRRHRRGTDRVRAGARLSRPPDREAAPRRWDHPLAPRPAQLARRRAEGRVLLAGARRRDRRVRRHAVHGRRPQGADDAFHRLPQRGEGMGRAGEGRGAGRCAGRVGDLPPLPVVAHEPTEHAPQAGGAPTSRSTSTRRALTTPRAPAGTLCRSRVTVPQGAVFNEDAFPTLGGRGGAA
jgi:hypothetical protein